MLSNRHPVALAEETALLDHVSGGRFELGVGRGGPWVDLEVFGTGLGRYEQGFGESLDLLLASLERGSVAADGERGCFFRFREIAVVPRPATRARPPVAVAATSTGTLLMVEGTGDPRRTVETIERVSSEVVPRLGSPAVSTTLAKASNSFRAGPLEASRMQGGSEQLDSVNETRARP